MKLFVGIDVSMKDFKARVFDAEGKEIAKRIRCKNDDPGAESFVKYLVEICGANEVDSLRIGLESTSVYGWHLQMRLAGEASLASFHPLAEIGDIHRFDNEKALAKFTGLTWKKHQSGKFEADDTQLTKTGNVYLRYYFVMAADTVRIGPQICRVLCP